MIILVVNSGSSSIKYQLFDTHQSTVLTAGIIENIGEARSRLNYRWIDTKGKTRLLQQQKSVANHEEGFTWIITIINELEIIHNIGELSGIDHRVVHGGEVFTKPALIDASAVNTIREMIPLAPLHNSANLTGIEVCLKAYPYVPQVAVFDTAYHQTMPEYAYRYALPEGLYTRQHVRRYGFHGTSHQYAATQAAKHIGQPLETLNLITLHLGNGASAAAIRAGRSVDTSMGMTPLEGLMMGTRCGDLDPAIHLYMSKTMRMRNDEVDIVLNQHSGLKGICGTHDMREVQRLACAGDERARLAIDMYCYRIKKYIGAYFAVLGHVDVLVFTAAIGENAHAIRKQSCEGLTRFGIAIDDRKNQSTALEDSYEIQTTDAAVKILVIHTNEELEIARQTAQRIILK